MEHLLVLFDTSNNNLRLPVNVATIKPKNEFNVVIDQGTCYIQESLEI